jgi:hypothetical protein
MGLGSHVKFEVHPPMEISADLDATIKAVEKQVISGIQFKA